MPPEPFAQTGTRAATLGLTQLHELLVPVTFCAYGLRASSRLSRHYATLGIKAAYWSNNGKTFSRPADGTKKIARSAPNS